MKYEDFAEKWGRERGESDETIETLKAAGRAIDQAMAAMESKNEVILEDRSAR